MQYLRLKVPKEQVKQRVMIVLQAELDINTEVQKRGRITVPGQILKPIYDYVTSPYLRKKADDDVTKETEIIGRKYYFQSKAIHQDFRRTGFFWINTVTRLWRTTLLENKEVNDLLDDPIKIKRQPVQIHQWNKYWKMQHIKLSGRVAVHSLQNTAGFL